MRIHRREREAKTIWRFYTLVITFTSTPTYTTPATSWPEKKTEIYYKTYYWTSARQRRVSSRCVVWARRQCFVCVCARASVLAQKETNRTSAERNQIEKKKKKTLKFTTKRRTSLFENCYYCFSHCDLPTSRGAYVECARADRKWTNREKKKNRDEKSSTRPICFASISFAFSAHSSESVPFSDWKNDNK